MRGLMRRLILRGLEARGAQRRALLTAFLLGLPALGCGLFIDDYGHLATLQGEHFIPAQWYNLFQFASDQPGVSRDAFIRGPLPWFTEPGIRLRFFRPLSSLSMALDWHLFGHQYWLYHLHSLLWCLGLVLAAGWMYRRELSAPTAALAVLLFALDESHTIPTVWWSNRNALVAALPAVLGLCAHLRWREDGWRAGLPLSLLCHVLGLCGGEGAIGIAGYLFAYELLARRDAMLRRAAALVPAATVFSVYLLLYKWHGFGVRHSGIYVDPIEETGSFLLLAPGRLFALLSNLFLGLTPELTVVRPWTMLFFAASGLAALVWGVHVTWRHWEEIDPRDRRAMAWLVLGAAVSLAPALSTFPSSRLLTLASLGIMAALAVLLRLWAERLWEGASGWTRRGGALLAGIHLFVPIFYWVVFPLAIAVLGWQFERILDKIALDEARVPEQRIFTLAASDPASGFYPQIFRIIEGKSRPLSWQMLSSTPGGHRVTRVAERVIDLEPLDFPMMTSMFEVLICHGPKTWPKGSKASLGFMEAEVMEADARGVYRVRFTFDRPLEDPQYVFLAWQDGVLRPFEMPQVGESRETTSRGGPLDFLFGA